MPIEPQGKQAYLLAGLKAQVRLDNCLYRHRNFEQYAKSKPGAWPAYRFLHHCPILFKSLLCIVYGYLATCRAHITKASELGTFCKNENEKRETKLWQNYMPLIDIANDKHWQWHGFKRKKLGQLLRILMRLNKKYPLFSCLRSAEYILFYENFRTHQDLLPQTTVVYSDSAPHALALEKAALVANRNTAFIARAYPTRLAGLPQSQFWYLLGESHLKYFAKQSPTEHAIRPRKVFYRGKASIDKPMQALPTDRSWHVGILLGKLFDLEGLCEVIEEMGAFFPVASFRLRPHPNLSYEDQSYYQSCFARSKHPVSLETEGSIDSFIAAADLCVAGNTSAHLDSLKQGKVSLYSQKLDGAEHDLYLFIEQNIVLDWQDRPSIERLQSFYFNNDWRNRFTSFFYQKESEEITNQKFAAFLQQTTQADQF